MNNLGQEFSVDPSNGEVKSASYREKKKKKKACKTENSPER